MVPIPLWSYLTAGSADLVQTSRVGTALDFRYFLERDFPWREHAHLGRGSNISSDARSQIDRYVLSAVAEEVVAEGQIGDRNFVPTRRQIAEHKTVGLAACNGLSMTRHTYVLLDTRSLAHQVARRVESRPMPLGALSAK
jgi:hypothetical protein